MSRAQRITDNIRYRFVNAVLADVPQVDYEKQVEELARSAAIKTFPKAAMDVFKSRPDFFASHTCRVGNRHLYLPGDPEKLADVFKRGGDVDLKVCELQSLAEKQSNAIRDLRNTVHGMLSQFNTVESAAKGMPDFAKYLPITPETDSRMVPVANAVAALQKAGWPKGQALPRKRQAVAA